MLLLSKLFPKLRGRGKAGKDKTKGVTSESDILSTGEKPQDYNCKILLLDDSELALNVKPTAKGQAVIDKVYCHLNLVEKDYFGLRFLDNISQTHWLDPTKTVGAQLKTLPPHHLYFGVKFYAADPCKLQEEITRYQFFLQVKRDILQGRLPVNFDLSSELSAYCVQSELGDYDPKRHSPGYVSEFRFVPNQTEDLEVRISQLHKMLGGMVPAAAEYRMLDKVKWLDMYGVDLHPVQGEGNIDYSLGLTPQGIIVYRNKAKVGNYFWPRLTKITFKGKFFMVRVKDKNNDENTYAFECISKAACKHLWKCCIEHHAFFRLTSANESYKVTGRLFNLGSSKYRYSGRTERQLVSDNAKRAPPKVTRQPSKRYQRRSASETRLDAYKERPPVDAPNLQTTTEVPALSSKSSAYHRAEGYQSAPESPRSTRSAPWINHNSRKGGLYTSGQTSPLSVRSEMFPKRVQSGSESESGTVHRRRSRHMESETEGEYDARRQRHMRIPADTDGESEANYRQRRHRKSTESLPYTQHHWRDVQTRVRDGTNGSLTSMQSDPTGGAKRRRNRRSRSPGNRKPPEELAQHFKYIDPAEAGISEDQMREIGYETVVVSGVPAINVKAATRSRNKSPRRRSHGELSERGVAGATAASGVLPIGEAPPPYADTNKRRRQKQLSQPNLHYSEPAGARGGYGGPEPPREPAPRGRTGRGAREPSGEGAPRGRDSYGTREQPNGRVPPVNLDHLQQPAVIQRNMTHSAPIVKTKPMAYASPISSSSPAAPAPQQSPQTPMLPPGDMNLKHTRDDSGLGPEQDNGSLNSSSSLQMRYYYMGQPGPSLGPSYPMLPGPPHLMGSGWPLDHQSLYTYPSMHHLQSLGALNLEAPMVPPRDCDMCYVPAGYFPAGDSKGGYPVPGGVPPGGPQEGMSLPAHPPLCPCYHCVDRMVSPAGSHTSHSLSQGQLSSQGHVLPPQGHGVMSQGHGGMSQGHGGISQGHSVPLRGPPDHGYGVYMPPAPKPIYSSHVAPNASNHHRKSRHHEAPPGYHGNHSYNARYQTYHNGTVRTHSEKMTEL